MQVGEHLISEYEGSRPFIIAEVGSNFRDLDDCLVSVAMAKAAGATAVKFQAFTHKALYGYPGRLLYELPLEWIPKLKEQADKVGIEFMCTAFDVDTFWFVNQFVNLHKIASCESSHVELLDALLASGKPALVSVGAQSEKDIDHICDHLGHHDFALMYCVAKYPARETNFFKVRHMRWKYRKIVGLSDHSIDVFTTPLYAKRFFGINLFEKHFSAIKIDSPDAPHSLNVDQFRTMCDAIRGVVDDKIGYSPEEVETRRLHTRRLIATKDIKEGDTLVLHENYGIFRPKGISDTAGLSPFKYLEINGKTSRASKTVGEPITAEDVSA